ncbi:hypothetical protein H0H93_014130 [Arthromyces matolae]|nr:hypothetical protein H0H93_014130 [Arthromyces matolae]
MQTGLSKKKGLTDRISLQKFYPFLACLAECARNNPVKPDHRALRHEVTTGPDRNAPGIRLPNGVSANILILGKRIVHDPDDISRWWPTAPSPLVRELLYRRVQREGYLLPVVLSVCVALLREMYTTEPDGNGRRRVRLKQGKTPIADFGIAKGAIPGAKSQDKLAYFYSQGEKDFVRGQEPTDHYWFYFTNINGHKTILDVGLYSINFRSYSATSPYLDGISHTIPHDSAPSFFMDHTMLSRAPRVCETAAEFSVLRNSDLQTAVSSANVDWEKLYRFMDQVAGKDCTEVERALVKYASIDCCQSMGRLLESRAYETWPEAPHLYVDGSSPDEVSVNTDDEETREHKAKWIKKYNRGKITLDEFIEGTKGMFDTRTNTI